MLFHSGRDRSVALTVRLTIHYIHIFQDICVASVLSFNKEHTPVKSKLFLILVVGSMMLAFLLNTFAQDSSQWHLPEGAVLRLGKGGVGDIEYSPDGTRLAVSSAVGIWLYDAQTGEELDLLTGQKGIIWWDADTGQDLRSATHILELVEPGRDTPVALSPDGKVLATGSEGERWYISIIRLWDVDTGHLIHTSENTYGSTRSLQFSPDGKKIAWLLSDSGHLWFTLWDVDTGIERWTSLNRINDHVLSVAFNPDGKTIASGQIYNGISIWDTNTGKILHTLPAQGDEVYEEWEWEAVRIVAFSPDGKTIASDGKYRVIHLWDTDTGKHIRTVGGGLIEAINSGTLDSFRGHRGTINSIAFSPDGKTIATGSSRDGTFKFWDMGTGEHLHTITGHNSSDDVESVAFSPDGKIIASGAGNTVRLWDAGTGETIHTLTGHKSSVNSVAFSPDGKTIISGSGDDTVKLWDVDRGEHLRTLTGHTGSVNSVAFSPDGKTIISGSGDDTVKLWDVDRGEHLRTLTGHTEFVTSVAFSPDEKIIASGSGDKTIRLWDAGTGEHLRTLTGHTSSVRSVAFSPDGKTIISGSWDDTVKLWDVDRGELLRTLTGDMGSVYSVAFRPDGKTIASSSWDYTINISHETLRLWDADTGHLLRTIDEKQGGVKSVAFSPDGKVLASGGRDGTVFLWDIAMGHRPEDINSDGVVNIQDLVLVAQGFGESAPDLNGDGIVNIQDLVLVAAAF